MDGGLPERKREMDGWIKRIRKCGQKKRYEGKDKERQGWKDEGMRKK